ncbi:MAG: ABC transporter ATP-binding protein [Oscillospiraceae bacterium]|nr:ABC transporter ATP-binding protein [Oscillospiraceae bacterium]
MDNLLEIKGLRVSYHTYQGEVQSVRGVDLEIGQEESVALVGESGCGKSVTGKSILRLIQAPGEILPGSQITFDGRDVLSLSKKELRAYRGGQASIIFQDALAALNPTMTVGRQIMENLLYHRKIGKREARAEAIRLLGEVGIPNPEKRVDQYPHEFSGGMRQRVMIAIAFACQPQLLIADEPTTALDVTIQAQIIKLLKQLQRENHTSILMITHDLGVVASIAQRIFVMYSGVIVERGSSDDIFYRPRHPYTRALLQAVPRMDQEGKQELNSIEGTPPDLIAPPEGCPFASRCKYAMPVCARLAPEVTDFGGGHRCACWLYHEMAPRVAELNDPDAAPAGEEVGQ